MTQFPATRFDPAQLRALADAAGPKTYARGESYAGGQVSLLSLSTDRVIAEAYGTENYAVRLLGGGSSFTGSCNCPAFDAAGFCKHMVAVALTANAVLADGEELDSLCSELAAHLASFGHQELIAYACERAETNPALFRRIAVDAGLTPRIVEDEDW